MKPNAALLSAFKDVRNGVFGKYSTESTTSYVIDPTDGTLWDLKPVLGRTLEKLGVDLSRGHDTHELARLCRQNGVDFEQVVFKKKAKRPLGMRVNESELDTIDWSKVKVKKPKPSLDDAQSFYYVKRYNRDPNVVMQALAKANGICQGCKKNAPFISTQGDPFLEVHHIIPLSHGGQDILDNVIALCPNCHRRQHFGEPDTF